MRIKLPTPIYPGRRYVPNYERCSVCTKNYNAYKTDKVPKKAVIMKDGKGLCPRHARRVMDEGTINQAMYLTRNPKELLVP